MISNIEMAECKVICQANWNSCFKSWYFPPHTLRIFGQWLFETDVWAVFMSSEGIESQASH